MSMAERAEYASRVKALRLRHDLTQQELADAAGVTRQTIGNLETGSKVPQAEVLGRVLAVLGVEVDGPQFEAQTDMWLTMMGTLIEAIPAETRPSVVNGAMRVLADGIRAGSEVEGKQSDVALAAFDQPDWQARQEQEHEL